MQKETLKYISDCLTSKNIPYDFEEYKAPIDEIDRYWVGEYQEITSISEDGCEESNFILTGTGKDDILVLENDKQTIRSLFPPREGRLATIDNGSKVAIFYDGSQQISTGDAMLKKIQIELTIKEWRVD